MSARKFKLKLKKMTMESFKDKDPHIFIYKGSFCLTLETKFAILIRTCYFNFKKEDTMVVTTLLLILFWKKIKSFLKKNYMAVIIILFCSYIIFNMLLVIGGFR